MFVVLVSAFFVGSTFAASLVCQKRRRQSIKKLQETIFIIRVSYSIIRKGLRTFAAPATDAGARHRHEPARPDSAGATGGGSRLPGSNPHRAGSLNGESVPGAIAGESAAGSAIHRP